VANVTVVNDYPAFLELVDAMLTEAGHVVRSLDGQHASLDEIAATEPDLLIIDVLVHGDAAIGWDVLALARTHDRLRTLPIIVCTAEVLQPEERLAELAHGDIRVIEKPFKAEELYAAIDRLLPAG
jgi:two-component system nitrogen regulation response regulator NtrX